MLMSIAKVASQRSTCHRLNVGAVLSCDYGNVLSIGYNGAPRGKPHCGGSQCEYMSDKGCTVIHAEQNAIEHYDGDPTIVRACYVTHSPCTTCAARLIMAGIRRVYYEVEYRDTNPLTRLTKMGVEVYRLLPSGYLVNRDTGEVSAT